MRDDLLCQEGCELESARALKGAHRLRRLVRDVVQGTGERWSHFADVPHNRVQNPRIDVLQISSQPSILQSARRDDCATQHGQASTVRFT